MNTNHSHRAKKRFGQNFLVDEYIIHQIVRAIDPKPTDRIVEIGPGLGAITKPILELIDHLDVIELDRDIIGYLKKTLADKIMIHEGDALKFDYSFNNQPIRIVGNLPYNISTPLLFHLAQFENIVDMHFMLQKEVAERICAKHSSNDYGRLSVMLQVKFKCYSIIEVGPESFYPAPKVESSFIKMVPKPIEQWKYLDLDKLNQVVSRAFNQRRKTIANSLKPLFTTEQLEQLGLDIKKRPENLSVEEYIKLSQTL